MHTSHYSRLEKPHIYSDCHPSKTTTYILHVVSITTHTHDKHKSIGEIETKKRKEDKGKERKEKKNETGRKRQAKRRKRQEKQEKTRQESKERKREDYMHGRRLVLFFSPRGIKYREEYEYRILLVIYMLLLTPLEPPNLSLY